MQIEQHDISRLFNILHDGAIINHQYDGHTLILVVEIAYLTRRINPAYTLLTISLSNATGITFHTWPNTQHAPAELLTDIDVIFTPTLDILESVREENAIKVICNQSSDEYAYCGGELFLECAHATIVDESGTTYAVAALAQLAQEYWNDWASSNRRC
jgi:hypothetical protein